MDAQEEAATDWSHRWYVISTRTHHEKRVHQQLVRKNVEAFLPTVPRWSRWTDRNKRIDWPLFPGYCFARFDASNVMPILTCPGVHGIVSFGGAPVAVPDGEVDGIRLVVNGPLPFDSYPHLQEGLAVRVIDGPLRGVTGRLTRKDLQRASIVLSVDLIGQALRVEVAAADVVPLGEAG